jgi:cell division protein FtsW
VTAPHGSRGSAPSRTGTSATVGSRPESRKAGTATASRGAPAARDIPVRHRIRFAIGRTATALGLWLRHPLTSLHLVLGVFGLLTLFGLVMVLSASSVESYTADGSSYSVFSKQLMFCVPGLFMFWLGLRISPRRLRALAPAALVVGLLSLVAVLFVGDVRNGSRSWFAIGSFSLQPSEAVKVALTLWGAHVLVARRAVIHRWRYAISPVVPVTVVLLTLLVLQPDLGMTVSLGIVLIALLFFAGAPMRLLLALCGGAIGGVVVLALSAQYRLARITAFLSPGQSDPLGARFQINQAMYSLADGGLFGVGLGQGRAKWDYLPNAHNDFIFAIIGEELGFLGAFAVLALFATLAYTGFRIAARSSDPWLKVVVATSTTWLVAQAAINISYVVGLLPVTGLQLPLISSGGTSLVVTMFVFGILANAARHEPEAVAALKQHGQGRIARLLWLPLPEPYRAPVVRPSAQRGPVR